MRQPTQPMHVDDEGTIRFARNKIVADLLDFAEGNGFGLNEIGRRHYTQEDRCQFAQLIGYSLTGYHELSYVSDAHASEATLAAQTVKPGAKGCRDNGCEIHSGIALEKSDR